MNKDQLFQALLHAKDEAASALWRTHARGLGDVIAMRLVSRLSSDHEARRNLIKALHDLDDAVMNPQWKESR